METPTEYRTEPPLYPQSREQILHSPYFQKVARTADSMIMTGTMPLEDYADLIEDAIAFTDQLIVKVGEKL